MNSPRDFYAVCLIGFICLRPASTIRCYQCSSYTDPGCESVALNETSPFLKECEARPDFEVFCRKTVQTVIDARFTRITRSCGWYLYKTNASNCLVADTDFKLETSCQCFTDACNFSNLRAVLPPLNVLLLSTTAVISLSIL